MKKFIFTETLGPLIDKHRPGLIVETGTHSGRSATFMCSRALQYRPDVVFHGFDLFDMASDETHRVEINGKGSGNYDKAFARLSGLQTANPGFGFQLYRGFTTDTFLQPIQADLAYIDGGHSTETVIHDWSMVRESSVIVFDDYQMQSVRDALIHVGLIDQIRVFAFGKTQQAIWERA